MKRIVMTTTAALGLMAAPALAATNTDGMIDSICKQGYGEIDMDGDGKLTQEEVANTTDAMFPKMDRDQSGAISQEEFSACLNASAGQEAQESDRKADNMAEYDTDDDGTLTREEFMNAGTDAAARAQSGDESADEDLSRLMFIPVTEVTPDYSTWRPDDFAVRSY
ncbi:EF-hand domain-containing protein, partial [Cribrihabitans sp. XS_ASV171]